MIQLLHDWLIWTKGLLRQKTVMVLMLAVDFPGWERDREGGAISYLTLCMDRSSVGFDNLLDDRQS